MKQTIITILLALVAVAGQAQTSFDLGEDCLNVIDVSYARGIGKYGDGGLSANYLHEKFINERFSIGAGIGYSHHKNYKFSAIPIYLSTHYFFLDSKFSPFVNLRVGGFALFNAKNVGTNEKYVSLAEGNVIGGVDAVVSVACHSQRPCSIKEQFAFAVERALVRAARSVGQRVRGAVGQDDEGPFATQQVQRRRVR